MKIILTLGALLGNFKSLMMRGRSENLPDTGRKWHSKNQESERLWISQAQNQNEEIVPESTDLIIWLQMKKIESV